MDLFSPTPIYSCWSSPSSLLTKQINIFPTRLYRFCGTFLVGQFPEMLLSSSEEKSSLPINNMFCVPSASVSELLFQRYRRFWRILSRNACTGLFSGTFQQGNSMRRWATTYPHYVKVWGPNTVLREYFLRNNPYRFSLGRLGNAGSSLTYLS